MSRVRRPERRGRGLPHRRGFTLLEGVVALTIVGMIATITLGALGADLRATSRARDVLVAESLASERLARVRLLDASELEGLPDSLRRGSFAAPLADRQWTADVARVRGDDGLYDVRVTVSWPAGSYLLASRIFAAPMRGAGR